MPTLAHCRRHVLAALLASAWLAGTPAAARAVAPDGPEVKQLVERALKWLETNDDPRLGAQCLVGLAFYKAGRKLDHPKIVAAQRACEQAISDVQGQDNYSVGLALVFLLEINPERNLSLAGRYTTEILRRQQAWGSWSYDGYPTGDTSQTQYPVLGLWLAINNGIAVPTAALEKTCGWLLRTQDPSGAWGYQGQDPGHFNRVPQTEIRPALAAAGLGSLYITADMLGLLDEKKKEDESGLPPALKPVADPLAMPKIAAAAIDPRIARRGVADGNRWFGANFRLESEGHTHYYHYAYERYQSFREAAERRTDNNPRWYNDIYNYLRVNQQPDGSWNDGDGAVVATSFAVLTLLRSAKKTIAAHSVNKGGKGILLGGMGLPPKTADLQERDGKLLGSPLAGNLDELLAALEAGDQDRLDRLADLASQTTLDPDVAKRSGQIARLRAFVSSGPFHARLVAVRTLARLRDFDNVPSLIYAMKDPDLRIVVEADRGLRFISRKLEGVGLPAEPQPSDVAGAIEAWKAWFRSVRPNAEFLD
jgi:hypothetical protein